MDVTGKKRGRRGWLVIMNFRRVAFCFLISLLFIYFLVFLLFASYGVWFVVLRGVSAPKSEVGGGALFP
jgi:hypothetical protein